MSERPAAAFVTAALVAPLVLLCCLGPATLVSLLAGFVAWLGGLGVAPVVAITIAGGILAYAFLQARKIGLRRRGKLNLHRSGSRNRVHRREFFRLNLYLLQNPYSRQSSGNRVRSHE